jgi:hypothetical protein
MKTPLCLALASVSLFGLGCDKKETPPAPAASAVAPAPPPSVAVAPASPAQPPSADIDVATLQKHLSCQTTGTGKQACRILAEFAEARRFSGDTPSGEGKWFGFAYTVEKKAEKTDLMIFAAKKVGTAQIGPNDLPIRVGFGTMPEDKKAHGQKLAAALSRSDVVGKNNQAQPFVKSFVPTGDRGVVPTTGASVRLISDEVVYVREGPNHKILVVRPRISEPGAPGAPGEGTYAELWLASW